MQVGEGPLVAWVSPTDSRAAHPGRGPGWCRHRLQGPWRLLVRRTGRGAHRSGVRGRGGPGGPWAAGVHWSTRRPGACSCPPGCSLGTRSAPGCAWPREDIGPVCARPTTGILALPLAALPCGQGARGRGPPYRLWGGLMGADVDQLSAGWKVCPTASQGVTG